MAKKKNTRKTNKSANGNWLDVLGYSNIFQNEKEKLKNFKESYDALLAKRNELSK